MARRVCDNCGEDKDVSGGKTCRTGHFICHSCAYRHEHCTLCHQALFGGSRRISTLANTLPRPADRAAVEEAIRRALNDRGGDWQVTITEPANASYWQVVIEGPASFRWTKRFDGPDEQMPKYIESRVREAVDARLPTFATIATRLDSKWTRSNNCPVCAASEWSVSQVPYALKQIEGATVMPLYPVSCTNCGLTMLFNAIAAGLMSDSPEYES